jgi:tetratricopeptide (TPR) repeat protein
LFAFARSLSARHHHGTAIELLRIAARDTSDGQLLRSRLHRELGFSCLNLELGSETAVQLLERSIELDPLDHQAHFLLGRAHQRRHRPEQAGRSFERAIQLQPDAAPYYTELARSMIASGPAVDQTARAGSVLAKAIEIDSSNASARFELAKLEMGQGRLDEAEQQLLKALEAAPEFFEAYYVLGQVYARAKKTAQSRECMQLFQAKKSAIEARSTIWKDATVRVDAE